MGRLVGSTLKISENKVPTVLNSIPKIFNWKKVHKVQKYRY
jgi:hypothetical protein